MSVDHPLLTMAIPTYNRSKFLRQLLEVLAPQLAGETRIELLISDNASSDETPAVVEEFRAAGLNIVYKRNSMNIGPDANFLQCYELAKGEYFWLIGDDDVIVSGGVRHVLRALEGCQYDLLAVSSYEFRTPFVAPDPARIKGNVQVFPDAVSFALRRHTGLSFITANIVRKTKLESNPHVDFRSFVGSNLVHLSWTYSLLSMDPKCALIQGPIVAARTENTGGFGTCQVFGNNIRSIVQQILGEDSPLGRALIHRNLQSFLPWATVQDRAGRSVNNLPEDTEAALRKLYGASLRYWIFLWPALKLPLALAKVWVFGLKVTNRLDRVLGHPMAR